MATRNKQTLTSSRNLEDSYFEEPILSPTEERQLLIDYKEKGSQRALDKLVISHARLAVKQAKAYKRYGVDNQELVQEGIAGLLHAAKQFDLKHETRYSTYALWWVKAFIQDYILHRSSPVRVVTTNDRKKLFFKLNAVKAKLNIAPGETLSGADIERIAETLQVSQKDVEIMNGRLSGRDMSLNEQVGDEGGIIFQDLIEAEGPSPEEETIAAMDIEKVQAVIKKAMEKLNKRERYIISNRTMNTEPKTLEELSQVYGISRERIRQIESAALEKLRRELKRNGYNAGMFLPS